MIQELLEKLLHWQSPKSSDEAKRRLKLVIAHDRVGLSPEKVEEMRQEILAVVAKYVEVDPEEMEFDLSSSDRMTALVANLPIRRVRDIRSLE
ncbi:MULTISPECIES: cell division topological specificity factor MinE [Cyanophyceae]|uniref:cell division topological specificity factor MinE n=1 Tax=Cyanophyceae TaxID=3028117 RepID=UPI00016DC82D|nr:MULTISPECIES: cell division topological specificity factor MinE [Cyanophyceae]ACA98522.1 cell division topological specificity factor, MinE [Picosynechococcus sp. PCC 7002]AMA08316.1 cell division topological specificity factor [Picosynechococcus sp. PCC 73109]ANV86456.1 cell division topological specificity factor MinE [Picosynechococcus sp. PCC 7117]ANV89627.1 cell division topological specificity factor MinE [Picosynechococcus sp. PCC 8807]QCS49138.1 cell division topological specificity